MPVQPITTEFLAACPPQGPHTVTFHVPDWKSCMRIRDGDPTVMAQLKSVYPRFAPFGTVKQLAGALHKFLALSATDGLLYWTVPDALAMATAWGTSPLRKDNALSPSELSYRVVDIHDTRLFVITFPALKGKIMMGAWQNPGLGPSTRLAESLLPHVGEMAEVKLEGGLSDVPEGKPMPEGEAHGLLRDRISGLLHRAALDPDSVKVTPADVFLYPTGMAAIYRAHAALLARKDGKVLVLGSVFFNTWRIVETTPRGYKHFGALDFPPEADVLAPVSAWLDEEKAAGRPVSYIILEFPSNPLLVSTDLSRLRALADAHDVVLVVDDTVGSFANIDLTGVADMIVSSTTKSFSGYADVMGGSVVLLPESPRYAALAAVWKSRFQNEVFSADAAKLLANSDDYLARSTVLNRNAATLAALLAAEAALPGSPVTKVLHPSTSPTLSLYQARMRVPTADFTPGHGCLLSVDLATQAQTEVFFDALHFHGGPHLGAHRTLAIPFNATVFGKEPSEAAYHASYGMRVEQVRISVGLEDEAELIAVVKEALEAARGVKG